MQTVRQPVRQLNRNYVSLLIAVPLENVSERDVWGEIHFVPELGVGRKVSGFSLSLCTGLHS